MSESTQPPRTDPHSIRAAAIGNRLKTGHGREVAKIIWWIVLSLEDTPACRSNIDLGDDAGLPWSNPEQQTQRAIKCLVRAGMLATEMGHRGTERRWGRTITPNVSRAPRVFMPDRDAMVDMWAACKVARPRPAAMVSLMTGLYVLAAHRLGKHPTAWAAVPWSVANIRRFVGASMGSTFDRRLAALDDIGMVRVDRGVWIAPPSEW